MLAKQQVDAAMASSGTAPLITGLLAAGDEADERAAALASRVTVRLTQESPFV